MEELGVVVHARVPALRKLRLKHCHGFEARLAYRVSTSSKGYCVWSWGKGDMVVEFAEDYGRWLTVVALPHLTFPSHSCFSE